MVNTVDAGYKNHQEPSPGNGSRISYIKHVGYKNIPDIRTSFLLPRVFL